MRPNFEKRRAKMIARQVVRRGVKDPRLLMALEQVPRERFVADELAAVAYDDRPLPIGEGQTISQPYIVALTLEALQLAPEDRVLEVGTGSGYAAAVLSRLAREVYSIERFENLANAARERLAQLGYDNVHVIHADGSLGLPEHAPYDAIAVAAVGPRPPPALLDQLRCGGRLVMPVGPDGSQVLKRITRVGSSDYQEESLVGVRFVPLIGEQGFAPADSE